MPTDVNATLKRALKELHAERARIDRQIAAIETVLSAGEDAPRPRRGPKAKKVAKRKATRKGRRAFTAEEKAAARERMKKYWAEKKRVE